MCDFRVGRSGNKGLVKEIWEFGTEIRKLGCVGGMFGKGVCVGNFEGAGKGKGERVGKEAGKAKVRREGDGKGAGKMGRRGRGFAPILAPCGGEAAKGTTKMKGDLGGKRGLGR